MKMRKPSGDLLDIGRLLQRFCFPVATLRVISSSFCSQIKQQKSSQESQFLSLKSDVTIVLLIKTDTSPLLYFIKKNIKKISRSVHPHCS